MKILLSGCGGAMGRMVANLIAEKENMTIAAGVDKFPPKNADFPVFEAYEECDIDCDAIIDFSHPAALTSLLSYAQSKNLPAVLCTTGLSDAQTEEIKKASKNIAVFKSANMSLGVNLLTGLLKQAAQFLNGFDIEIVEKHHNKKVDAPSGTALMLADSINEALNGEKDYVHGRFGTDARRQKNEIGIHAVRGGTIVGEHQVHFIGPDEIIEIRHTALSKAVFAEGAIHAAEFIAGKPPGMYDMQDMLNK